MTGSKSQSATQLSEPRTSTGTFKIWELRVIYTYVWVAVGGEHIIVANKLVDLVWHEHILDTRVYMIDCTALFGRYLHHYPCFVDEVRTFTNSQKMRQL